MKPRAETDWDTVLAYIAAYEADERMPPIVVFEDDDRPGRYWLADGWHRLEAQRAEDEGRDPDAVLDYDEERVAYADDPTQVEAEIHPGGKIAAMRYAASANTTHGRRRTALDAMAAAKVAIRGLILQNPERRPTVEDVKATARVGTDTALRAFRELEAEQQRQAKREAETWLPPKDPRGGARDRFVPQGTNDACPDLDAHGMLPVVNLDGEHVEEPLKANAATAYDIVTTTIADTFAKGPGPGTRIVQPEHRAWKQISSFDTMWNGTREVFAIPAEEAAESWLIAGRTGDLAEKLEATARDIITYAAAVRAAKPKRLRLLKVADSDTVRRHDHLASGAKRRSPHPRATRIRLAPSVHPVTR